MARKRPSPYVPLSVYYADDEAIMNVGEDAELMFLRMLAYAGRTPTTEGYVSRRVCLTRLGIAERPEVGPESSPESRLERLTDSGLIASEGDGYRLVSWLRWNRSAEEMGREREQDRNRKAGLTRADPEESPETGPENYPEQAPESGRVPSGSTEADTDTDKRGARTRGTRLPDGWMPSPAVKAQIASERPDLDLRREHENFTDYWRSVAGRTGVKLDWDATWRRWMRDQRTNLKVAGGDEEIPWFRR